MPQTPMTQAADLFEKCRQFTRPQEVAAMGLHPYFKPVSENYGTKVVIEGRTVIMAGSNNYLGLTTDPRVIEAAKRAIEKYGTGCTGSRYLNGTLDIHIELEERLAAFMGKEACVLFSTGYQTNQGVIQALAGKGDLIFSDKDNHASIVVGTMMSLAQTVRYRHNDVEHLRRLLERADPKAAKLIVTDGVFSMSGALVRLPELVALAKEFGAKLMVDDAHAIGVIGPGGRGTAAYFGLDEEVDLITGTFSKSFASLGGFVVGEAPVIQWIRYKSPAHIFSASMPPANVATVMKCLEILQQEPWRLQRLQEISDYMRSQFRQMGFDIWESQTPIIPVVIGEDMQCFRFWRDLFDEGVYVNAVISPAVPPGQALLRTSYMATHTQEELDFILEAFYKVGVKHGIIDRNGRRG
ncbi:MAG: aminotransferase class I/II-fold pyridoxal phosphate-dependent enzyme [Bacteroidetes bacterium]|nr:aminotransferase class I/II-fold pyridoxal phosphate-dependent enzyme [Rhodothermia bacterium]MCS7155185.1 aminotransferase class I/II-fold pyridoxal phosphate-dependent enzyme [Bacteroidota bacterium]MCX7906188.1 aminotransferase class I/II-fold pyridoxal phosphate-dependent enzyme [Bacteroidota bacterium]MDW8138315.1 aminotransferase class I/II-fold pyridoxal phosphate-dependent enzyme [Bacteroidota bacterium]MDW8286000.1 aminotransferase class I/II-fold pyridoxal phosphate-dependent enzym